MLIRFTLAVCFFLKIVVAQRVAPGVPPQQYNAPVHQQPGGMPNQAYQQQQHQQQQYGQPPPPPQGQYQQQPQVQYQQPAVPQQQYAQPNDGHGHHHGGQQQVLNANIQMEKEHIAKHMDIPMDTSKMSEQELQFHYFKMHDADNNNKLDGCELTKSLIHWHEQGSKDPHNAQGVQPKLFTDEELQNLIDPIMKMDDLNNDGFIDYPEFIRAQQKVSENAQNQGGSNNI